jgi:hypothetical protein
MWSNNVFCGTVKLLVLFSRNGSVKDKHLLSVCVMS